MNLYRTESSNEIEKLKTYVKWVYIKNVNNPKNLSGSGEKISPPLRSILEGN